MSKPRKWKRMTAAQRAWCQNYFRETDFEAMMDNFLSGDETFQASARKSVRWFEQWSTDAHLNISRNIPGDEID